MSSSVLLGDIGATNARFALVSNGNLNAIRSFEVANFGQFADLLTIFLKEHCAQTQIQQALLAIAGPVTGKRVQLTNSSWVIDAGEPDLRVEESERPGLKPVTWRRADLESPGWEVLPDRSVLCGATARRR
jgi:hypothetical protein